MEVTCSDSDAVNGGSSQVTCTMGTDFTYSTDPSCSIPGMYIYIDFGVEENLNYASSLFLEAMGWGGANDFWGLMGTKNHGDSG